MNEIQVQYLGLRKYQDVLSIQERYFNELIREKLDKGKSTSIMQLVICQHEPVYTLGKNGDIGNLLTRNAAESAELIRTTRGGDITFHGPGQIVAYPVLDLERLGLGLARYIELLEESVMTVLKDYEIKGKRLQGASGVWLDVDSPQKVRKICALGIRSSRWITMHGLAFNINTDLTWFENINPCGFSDKSVTSLSKETGLKIPIEDVISQFTAAFCQHFNLIEKPVSVERV